MTKTFSTMEVAKILEVPESRVRALARAGEVGARRGTRGLEFSDQDLVVLRTTKGLMESGVAPSRIRRVWSSLRPELAADPSLSHLHLIAEGERIVASDEHARWQPDSGQLLMDFDAGESVVAHSSGPSLAMVEAVAPDSSGTPLAIVEAAAEAVPADPSPEPAALRAERYGLRLIEGGRGSEARSVPASWTGASATAPPVRTAPDDVDSAEEWFHLGCEREATSPGEARDAYQRAIELEPSFAEAHLNLGRCFHEAGELGKAEAHYRDAVRYDAEDPTPHFNLGVLLEDRGRPEEAVHAYRQAIARDATLADAHYNLALLLESLNRRKEAVSHFMEARRLYGGDPENE
jgi:tetratricopeptide (TPR) repeat protein